MAIQPCLMSYGDEPSGVALVDTVTGIPLQLSWSAIRDLEDAEAFLSWALAYCGEDIRELNAAELEDLSVAWATNRDQYLCDVEASDQARGAGYTAAIQSDEYEQREADLEHAATLAEEWGE